jgi:hypothetical protein
MCDDTAQATVRVEREKLAAIQLQNGQQDPGQDDQPPAVLALS